MPKKLSGATVLTRVDFNEPVKNGHIKDSFRVRATAPTIRRLVQAGARVVLLAHLEDSVTKKPISLAPYVNGIARTLGVKVAFVREFLPSAVTRGLAKSKVVLLENVRFHRGETTNDPRFARALAALANIYVNEAFSVSHRKHASIVGVPHFLPSFAGPLFQKEVAALSDALKPKHPFLLIIGGAKFSTKVELLNVFLPKADAAFIGGALANTFLRAHGLEVGRSSIEKEALPNVKKKFVQSKKIALPFDVCVGKKLSKSVFDVEATERIYDVGPKSVKLLSRLAREARYVLWNGPLGYIEEGYEESTRALLRALARLHKTKVIIGGGDTVEVLDAMRQKLHFHHVSTGGGAMLDFLADGSLPGIDALVSAQKRMRQK